MNRVHGFKAFDGLNQPADRFGGDRAAHLA
jgi:hypothetical protein